MVSLSARSCYAIISLLALARREGRGLVPAHGIASDQKIPPKYLEQILAALGRAGLVRSVRGLGGGYELARPASSVTLAEILLAIEGPPANARSLQVPAALEAVVARAEAEVARVFSVTLAELLAEEEARNGSMFYI